MFSRRQGFIALPAFAIGTARAQDTVALSRFLAPTGPLRAVINVGNPILANRRPGDPVPFGVSVDLARELARRLALDVELIAVPSAGRAVATMRADDGDIGFFALDPTRGQGIDFTAPFIEIEGTFLVHEYSPITAIEQVDSRGVRIAVGLNSAYDLFLRREIRNATLVRIATSPRVVEEFVRQSIDVAAGVRQQLEADAARIGGLRMLPGRFMVIEQALGLAGGRDPSALAYLRDFIEEMKASGFIAASLARHNIQSASVAGPG
ncbi:transporter substrate-binding domain-containing protein [Sediminicoccus sp. KRV36]|uniref:transporter substrate-binding domain-containing protein n=1 Tax=Sediminicoccus sp. KRV36 TaxID=3133721 RepID=UPI00200F2A51|nr:transporter substrate-binding domain-containing protein [Sediminicoccus rosea]UPY38705.1 transporter substrate-binding domain-containing protein [Sediminicoccus rosea]